MGSPIDRIEPTEHMVRAAAKAGQETGLLGSGSTAEVIARAMLAAALEAMPRTYEGPRYPFLILERGSSKAKKARILEMGNQPGYFRIETEDGQTMHIHANEFLPNRSTARKDK